MAYKKRDYYQSPPMPKLGWPTSYRTNRGELIQLTLTQLTSEPDKYNLMVFEIVWRRYVSYCSDPLEAWESLDSYKVQAIHQQAAWSLLAWHLNLLCPMLYPRIVID